MCYIRVKDDIKSKYNCGNPLLDLNHMMPIDNIRRPRQQPPRHTIENYRTFTFQHTPYSNTILTNVRYLTIIRIT